MEKFFRRNWITNGKFKIGVALVEYMVVGRINMNKLNVIYEDNHIIVVEKQPNIPSQAEQNWRYRYDYNYKRIYKRKI